MEFKIYAIVTTISDDDRTIKLPLKHSFTDLIQTGKIQACNWPKIEKIPAEKKWSVSFSHSRTKFPCQS